MTIHIRCPNGHRLRAKDSLAGRRFACPACGAVIVVPSGGDENPPVAEDERGLPASSPPSPPPPPSPTPALEKATFAAETGAASPARAYLLIGSAVAGCALGLIALLIAIAILPRGGVDTVDDSDAGNAQAGAALTEARTPPDDVIERGPPETVIERKPPETVMDPTPPQQVIEGKLRRIAIAFMNFHDRNRFFAFPAPETQAEPPAPRRGARWKPTELSWRVHLLPYLGQKPLYDRFHLDEPWDSAHNKPLLELMPEVFRIGSGAAPTSRIQVITGPDMLFGNATPADLGDIEDGPRHTILAVVTGPDRAVPWTQPDALTLDPSAPVDSLGPMPEQLVMCVMCDAQPLTMDVSIDAASLMAMATPNGGEIIDADALRRRFAESRRAAAAKHSELPSVPSKSGKNATWDVTEVRAKLQAVGLAMLNHNDQFGMLTHPSLGKFGSGLSWRVHLLPFLGRMELYRRFRLNEPWNSPHNRALLPEIPDVFRFDDSDRTRICAFTGPQTLLGTSRPMSSRDASDGPSNTMFALVVGPEQAAPWTRPGDIPFAPSNVSKVVEGLRGRSIECVMLDGELLTLPADIAQDTVTALITPRGGETLDVDALRRVHGSVKMIPALLARSQEQMRIKRERVKKLASLARAAQSFHGTHNQLPPPKWEKLNDENGVPYLSWRVHLLPFLEQGPLYKAFRLDEPWDSPVNRALIEKMPEVFRDPEDEPGGALTRIVTLTGPDTLFPVPHGPRYRDIRDARRRTILFVLAGKDRAVPWTSPEDIVFDSTSPIGCLGDLEGPGIYFAPLDGAASVVKASIPPKWFRALVTPSGGEELPVELQNFGIR